MVILGTTWQRISGPKYDWGYPKGLFHFIYIGSLHLNIDALLGPGVNPLEGSPNVKLRKLGLKGTLPASNSRKG